MPRDVSLHQHPIIEPGVCGKCGTQHSSWFVDLGFDTVFNYKNDVDLVTWCDGIVYLCAECTNSLVSDLFRAYQIYSRAEARELTPLKLIPITLDRKEDYDGSTGSSDGVDSDDTEQLDSDVSEPEHEHGDAAGTFRLAIAEAV